MQSICRRSWTVVSLLLLFWVTLPSTVHARAATVDHMPTLQSATLQEALFAGIIIGSLGAVTDVGMSVASAAHEVSLASRRIGPYELTRAALNVGRDIMGTMSNTLVLAYVGGAMPLLLLLMGYEANWLKIINRDVIATEIARGMAGSIGLVISIPITAVVAGVLMSKR